MPEIAYVNGRFCDLAEATVSIEDRGFQFADGVYEVVVAPRGRPFRLQQHLARLSQSTDGIDLPVDYPSLDLPRIVEEGIRRCGFTDALVYMQITRGVAPRAHDYADGMRPTVVLTFKPKPVIDPGKRERGIDLKTTADIRWAHCRVKSIALLPNVLLKNEAMRDGYADAIIVDQDGFVRETTCANLFIVSSGVLRTPPASSHILHGVTRAFVVECAGIAGIETREEDFSVPEMLAADEVFITSTTMDIMPVASIDGEAIGTQRPGPCTSRLYACFQSQMGNAAGAFL